MRRAVVALISCLSAALLSPAPAQNTGLTLDQIVEKHTDAFGGADQLKTIQTAIITGGASLRDGQIGMPVTIRIKRPALMRMDMHLQERTFVESFDGTTGWTINSFSGSNTPQKMSDEDARSALDNADFFEGSLVDYKAKGSSVELLGQQAVEGTSAYKLKITNKSGAVQYLYLDAASFLPIKTTGKRSQMGREMEYESVPSNYKAVKGVMIPFTIRQKIDGHDAMELNITQVDVNVPIDDSIFHMPEKPRDTR